MDAASQDGWDKVQITRGNSPDEVFIRVKCNSLYDVVTAIIRQSGIKQAAIASDLEMNADYFSRKFNNPGDTFYTALDQLDKIMGATGQIAPLEFLLAKRGLRVTPIEDTKAGQEGPPRAEKYGPRHHKHGA